MITKGPWKLDEDCAMIETEYPVNLKGDYEHICDFRTTLRGTVDFKNAHAIAKVPEFIALLQNLADNPYSLTPDQWASEARQALEGITA